MLDPKQRPAKNTPGKGRNFIQKKGAFIAPILLVLIGIVSHLVWFNPFAIISHGDFTYWPNSHAVEAWKSWGTWLTSDGFGVVNIQIPFLALISAWSLVSNLGLGYQVAVSITLLMPIAILGFLAPYYLLKNQFRSVLIAFAGALFYGSTTYFLIRQTMHMNICLVYALAPLIVLFFKRALEANSLKRWLTFLLTFFVATIYEIRIALLIAIILPFVYFSATRKPLKSYLKYALPIGALMICLSMFWLLPLIKGGSGTDISAVANRGLFGSNLFDLPHALTVDDSAWTGGAPNESFVMQRVPLVEWVWPLMALISAFLVYKYKEQKRIWISFTMLALLGIFLTKQAAPPLPNFYEFLYLHLPGFSLFREASKFYVLTAFAFLVLIGLSLKLIKEHASRYLYIGSITLIIFASFVNLSPLITRDMRSTFISRVIPVADKEIQDTIGNLAEFGRSLWVPTEGRWAEYSDIHPKTTFIGLIGGAWKRYFTVSGDVGLIASSQVTKFLQKPYAQAAINDGGMRWLIAPSADLNSDNNVLRYYGNDSQLFADSLAQLPWLTPRNIKQGQTSLYENETAENYFSIIDDVYLLSDGTSYDMAQAFTMQKEPSRLLNTTDREITGSLELSQTFADIGANNLTPNGVKRSLFSEAGKRLFVDHPQTAEQYKVAGGSVTFTSSVPPVVQINNSSVPVAAGSGGKSYKLESNVAYYTVADGVVDYLSLDGATRVLGGITESLSLMRKNETISMSADVATTSQNPCAQYQDETANVRRQLKKTNGVGFTLEAIKKPTCSVLQTGQMSNGEYLVEFSYRVENTHGVSYSYGSSAPAGRTRELLPVTDENWHTVRKRVSYDGSQTPFELAFYGYANDREGGGAHTEFKDISVSKVQIVGEIVGPNATKRVSAPLAGGQNTVSVEDQNVSTANIVVNPSFEEGLWQKVVGDCNNIDKNPQISMKNNQSYKKTMGNTLELAARRHAACTSSNRIPITENSEYLFSLDYQSPTRSDAGYVLSFNDPDNTTIPGRPAVTDEGWNTSNRIIKTPNRATEVTIILYAYADAGGLSNNINRYDNIGLSRIPTATTHIFNGALSSPSPRSEAKVATANLGPTSKSLKLTGISKGATIRMSETYNPNWRLEVKNAKVQGLNSWVPWAKPDAVAAENHFKLNDFENGWYVDVDKLCKQQNLCTKNADGSYDMELVAEFTPQRWFYVGLVISGLTLAGVLGYLGYAGVRRYKRRRPGKGGGDEGPTGGSPRAPREPDGTRPADDVRPGTGEARRPNVPRAGTVRRRPAPPKKRLLRF